MKDVLAVALFAMSAVSACATVPQDLTGVEWSLTAIDGKAVDGERPPTISFTRGPFQGSVGGQLDGYSGCNRYFGNFWLPPGGAIEIKVRGMTKMACEPARMQLERDFVAALDASVFYEWRHDGTLAMTSRDGRKQLSFKQLPAKPN